MPECVCLQTNTVSQVRPRHWAPLGELFFLDLPCVSTAVHFAWPAGRYVLVTGFLQSVVHRLCLSSRHAHEQKLMSQISNKCHIFKQLEEVLGCKKNKQSHAFQLVFTIYGEWQSSARDSCGPTPYPWPLFYIGKHTVFALQVCRSNINKKLNINIYVCTHIYSFIISIITF